MDSDSDSFGKGILALKSGNRTTKNKGESRDVATKFGLVLNQKRGIVERFTFIKE